MAALSTSLSDLLRAFRARSGLTQAALAEQAGLSEQAISVLERGTRSRPRIETVRALTKALDLDAAEAEQFLAVARGKRPDTGAPTRTADEPITASTSTVPWQLPPAARDFTGRGAQLEAMLSVLRNPTGTAPVGLVAVTGMGGIGKTTLAVQAAHRLVDSYPDGHLYLNLRGYGPGTPMAVAEALRQLLRSLGVDIQQIPDNVDEAAALLRSQLAGRRVILLLDNAADAQHVLPLLPGSAGSSAIITSRGSLAALPGARQVHLDALSESETVELLSAVIGTSRVAAEPAATKILAAYSGRLPLAVRLIGGRLATRPTWPIQHFVALLEDEAGRLDSLGSDGSGVRASIASSVQFLESSDRDLDRRAARALPLLSIPDGSDLLTAVAAALLDLPLRQADSILERLVDLNLLESVAPARYRLHDLIRAYGREIADRTLRPTERHQALERILRFYAAVGWAIQSLTHSTSPRLMWATIGNDRVPTFDDREQALRWMDAEQRNLMDRVRQAKQSTLSGSALFPELAIALFGYHESRRRWMEMRELAEGAVELAERHGLREVAAWLQHDSAIPEAEDGDAAIAIDRILVALTKFRAIGDRLGQARCCSSLAYLLGMTGRLDQALEYGETALALSRAIGDTTLEGVALTAVGGLYDRTGDFQRADAAFAEGIALAERAGDTRAAFKRHINASFAHLQARRYEDAVLSGLQGLRIAELNGDTTYQGEGRHLLAIAYAATGDFEAGAEHIAAGLLAARASRDVVREGRLYVDLARIDAASGQRSQATEHLKTAIALLHNTSEVHEADARNLLHELERGATYSYRLSAYSI